jgi:hypothetical protein
MQKSILTKALQNSIRSLEAQLRRQFNLGGAVNSFIKCSKNKG